MEKTTKKKKAKKKSLKKRIGLIAIGGLSLVLTVCLSVGATLAWFAGSTHADKSLFMGGPVYVEMTGKTDSGTWQGGSGQLDMNAGTGVLLPGSRFTIYSQARVFSTSTSDTTGTSDIDNKSSGANTSNTSKAGIGEKHKTQTGNKTTATNSVLRARFSVNVEFDPMVGFNNFTGTDYAENYPVQSGAYKGEVGLESGLYGKTTEGNGLSWTSALGASKLIADDTTGKYTKDARRDAVAKDAGEEGKLFTDSTDTDLAEIKAGTKTSIYSWKFVSKDVYNATSTAKKEDLSKATGSGTGLASSYKYVQMGAPFDGNTKVDGTTSVYYGVWILDGNGETQHLKESDSFYKARCNNYIQTYVEHYPTEYGDFTTRTVGSSLKDLENSLNDKLTQLVNDSSNAIIAGYLKGFTVTNDGDIIYNKVGSDGAVTTGEHVDNLSQNCSWLYVNPSIGNDTNTNELSTSKGGWWYLVECDTGNVGGYNLEGTSATDTNKINTIKDTAKMAGDLSTGETYDRKQSNTPTAGTAFGRGDTGISDSNPTILTAKLYEIAPHETIGEAMRGSDSDKSKNVYKVASYQFPFVNGVVTLDGKSITNIFANAKITIQVAFQAVQAFFPYTASIDGLTYKDTLLGTEKALNIKNAIPIFNEAFDYGA